MKSICCSITFLFLVLCAWTPSTRAVEDAEQVRKETYQILQRGDQLRDLQEWAEAIRSYREALDRYHDLAASAADWEQDYYRFRITHGEREIARIVRETGKSEAQWLGTAVEESLSTVEDPYRAMYEAMVEENRYLRSRIEVLEADLAMYEEMEEIESQREILRREEPVLVPPDAPQAEQEEPQAAPAELVPAPPMPRYPVADSGPDLFPPKRD